MKKSSARPPLLRLLLLLLGFNGPATEAEPSNHYNERERDSHTQRGGRKGRLERKSEGRRRGRQRSHRSRGDKGGGAVRRWEKWRETGEIPLLPFDLLGCYSSERHSAGKGKTRGRHQWLRVEKSKGICIFFCPHKPFVFIRFPACPCSTLPRSPLTFIFSRRVTKARLRLHLQA